MPWMAYLRDVPEPRDAVSGLEFRLAIGEGVLRADLSPYDASKWPWADYDRGWLFGPASEVRFRRRAGGLLHLVLVTDLEKEETPGMWQGWQRLKAERKDSRIILWGEWDQKAGGWFEGRIPIRLPYGLTPDVDRSRIALRLRHYRLTGATEVSRYCGLELAPCERRTNEPARE
jgi:hypothetical protein